MIHGLVLTHGEVGEALVEVIKSILGPETGLSTASNAGLSLKALTAKTEAFLAASCEADAKGVIIFIDDVAGSCATAARLAVAGSVNTRVVSGVNLAMLLDFLTWRDALELPELTRRVIEKGRHAIAEVAVTDPGEDA